MSFADPSPERVAFVPGPSVRLERDFLGEKALPADALYGIHAARAAENFPLSGRAPHPELVTALGRVKLACARANLELGYLSPEISGAVIAACEELISGEHRQAVVVDVLQGGAGTSANMNVNEILANRAGEMLGAPRGSYAEVDPLAHVNMHQSTNDVFPTAVRVAAISLLRSLERETAALQCAFQEKEKAFADVVRIGRTQLQEAAPMTLGAAFSAHAEAFARDRWRVFKCEERLRTVNLGGTALGTGIGAPRDYIFLVVEKLREVTGFGLSRNENLVDATQNADPFVEVSGILRAMAVNIFKISSDLRLLASGPSAGFGELVLPALQAGSSLMPGKINPVACEAAGQAAIQVMAADYIVTQSAQNGQLELNAYMPLLADALLGAISLLTATARMFRTKCVEGIEADRRACEEHVRQSPAMAVALAPSLGYAATAELALAAKKAGKSILDMATEEGLLDAKELERLLSPEAMTELGHRRRSSRGT